MGGHACKRGGDKTGRSRGPLLSTPCPGSLDGRTERGGVPRLTTPSLSPKAYLTLNRGREPRWREKVTMWLSGRSLGLQTNPQVQGKGEKCPWLVKQTVRAEGALVGARAAPSRGLC